MKKYKHIPTGNIATKNDCLKDDYMCGEHIPAWIVEAENSKDWELIKDPCEILSVKNCFGDEFKIGDNTKQGVIIEFKISDNEMQVKVGNQPIVISINELEKK